MKRKLSHVFPADTWITMIFIDLVCKSCGHDVQVIWSRAKSNFIHFLFFIYFYTSLWCSKGFMKALKALNGVINSNQYTDLQSQFQSSYYPFFGNCCYETEKFRVNLCFETREYSILTADDNKKNISQAL